MIGLDFAKSHLNTAMKQGQGEYDIKNMTDKEIIDEADALEGRADFEYEQWRDRFNE